MKSDKYIDLKTRELRNKHRLTQKELTRKTELTKNFLSQLERGLSSVSVTTLLFKYC